MAGPSVFRKLTFTLVTSLVIFGSVEAGLRAAGWPQPTGRFAHREVYWVSDPGLSEKVFPHNEEGRSFKVSTDANGLRAPLHAQDKPAGTSRILTLGCSTTFGWGVDDAESYPARLEALYREAGRSNVEVINGGQPGYTSFQGLWLWSETLRHYSPDVVLIGYVVQDARRAAYTDRSQAALQQDARFLKDNVLYQLRTYLGLRALLGGIQIKAKERTEGGEEGEFRVPPEDYAHNLRALVSAVREIGATPVLFGYPLEREGYTGLHRRILAAAGTELGAAVFDPQAEMERESNARTLYFPRDRGHANAEGNDLIARQVFAFLEKEALLGASP